MFQSTINEIKKNLLFVLDEVVKSRQYLNKHFQNSMNNYFLENYATLPCLKQRFDTQSGRQVRKEIFEKYNEIQELQGKTEGTLKCFLIMNGFIEEHKLNNSIQEYRQSLISMVNASTTDNTILQGSQEWTSLQWRRLFALMVLHHTFYPEIQGVYELWFHVFDERLIARERQKKKKEEVIYKKGKAPYIVYNKEEEVEQSNSVFENENTINSIPIVKKNEDSLSSISADDQHTQCSFDSPKSPPSLLNLKNVTSVETTVQYSKKQTLKRKESSLKKTDEPKLTKKRNTQKTLVVLKKYSISQIELCNSNSTFTSTNSLLQNPEQMQKMDLASLNQDQRNQQQQKQYPQSNQQIQYLQAKLSTNNALNNQYEKQASFYQNSQSVSNFYQSSYTAENKLEENMNVSQNQYLMQQYQSVGDQQQQNIAHQYQQPQFIYSTLSQPQKYHNNTYQSSYYNRQQSNYLFEENNHNTFIPHNHTSSQQIINQVGQNQNNTNLENNQDYYASCNQENYQYSQYESFNEDLNKLKYEQQSNPYTYHNLDNYSQYNHQINQCQEQIQPQIQPKIFNAYEQSPYESSHSTYADNQLADSAYHSSKHTSYSSLSSPTSDSYNSENNDDINLKNTYHHQYKVESDLNEPSPYAYQGQYSYQNMIQYNDRNFYGVDAQDIFSTLKSENI